VIAWHAHAAAGMCDSTLPARPLSHQRTDQTTSHDQTGVYLLRLSPPAAATDPGPLRHEGGPPVHEGLEAQHLAHGCRAPVQPATHAVAMVGPR